MKNGYRQIAGVMLLLAFILAACGSQTTPTAVPPVAVEPTLPVAVAQPTSAGVPDACGNSYYPVKNKANYAYTSSDSPAGTFSFRNSIGDASPAGFTITTKYRKLTITQTWTCKPEGLGAGGLGFTDAASTLAFDRFTNITATNITGVNVPANLAPGMEWTYALDLQGTENVAEGQTAGTMTGHMEMSYKALQMENIVVPAGTFDTIAIEVHTVSEFTIVSATGETQKISVDSVYTYWYAPGVGWIKSNGTGTLNGQEYYETIVLDSYKVP
jgi:hypothetical protein